MANTRVQRAAETAAVNVVPLVIFAIVVYALWRVFKAEAEGTLGELGARVGEGVGVQQTGELLDTDVVAPGPLEGKLSWTGAILEPTNGGRAARGLFRSTYPMRFTVHNPGPEKRSLVEVQVTEYSHWPFSNGESAWSDTLTLKPGRNVIEIKMPITADGFKKDAVARVIVDKMNLASNQYVIE